MTPRELAALAVANIVKDMCDRRGLRQAWEQTDKDTQVEIAAAWTALVTTALTVGSDEVARPSQPPPGCTGSKQQVNLPDYVRTGAGPLGPLDCSRCTGTCGICGQPVQATFYWNAGWIADVHPWEPKR